MSKVYRLSDAPMRLRSLMGSRMYFEDMAEECARINVDEMTFVSDRQDLLILINLYTYFSHDGLTLIVPRFASMVTCMNKSNQ